MYKVKGELIIDFSDESIAETILKAISPEINTIPSKRTEVSLKRIGTKIFLLIYSKDTTALRAAVNSYLRLIKTAHEVLNNI